MTKEPPALPDLSEQGFAPADLFLNRELSLLEFNRRVLEQALDESVPLLERLKFLCIASANLDEFFEIRVAGVQQMAELNPLQRGADGMTPAETLAAISKRAHELVDAQYRLFNDVIIPALDRERIRFVRRSEWSTEQDAWLKNYFHNELMPVLSPIGLDPAHPFPRILNKSLNFIVQLSGKDAFGRNTGFAIVQAPRALPRLIQIPPEVPGTGPHDFVFLSSVIHAYVDDLFPGMEATGSYQFRLTRNSDLLVDEEEVKDLMEALEGELSQRQWGDIVRLEVAHNCPEHLWQYLMDVAQLTPADVYQVNGPVNLHRLMTIPDMVDRPELKYPPYTPRIPKAFAGPDVFAAIRERDQLLQHPYESFMPVVDFLRHAARDPRVLAIKQTLYRTGDKSAVAEALIEAARNGKEVTVVVELRARFDEEANIDLAEQLQEVGAHVVYGVVGYKTHAKMCLVVRREDATSVGGSTLRYYAHLGTGNYHPRTARIYTDYGLFTADSQICKDVHAVFLQLTSLGKVTKLHRLLQSPFSLARQLQSKIEREIAHAVAGRPARIIAKMNALVESETILALYRASRAGVKVDLIVRGMCSLRPGVKDLSENIHVRSIIGRFLEHHRCYWFANDGDAELYLSSADWMERNLFRRVEVAFPVLDKKLRERVLEHLHAYLADTAQSWVLQPDGSYLRPAQDGSKPVQLRFMEEA
ncbi:MAG: polyphosphate kinase 1 [Sinimarinibacterium flocculans]|uniref:Polyphosphate kinase n=1 Tax=Sinimarinibacterium flocculans TaxID=985250 RepID=A0A318E705_9GAMM|nr:polyphosphate kinase 1 [Sinimarinibacterium flocculans]PXV66571.1 polyphosphate kinase [Sinimarinibacterium flocculans]